MFSDRKSVLEAIFSEIEPSQREVVYRLIDEAVFLEEKMAELKKLPFITTHPKRPSLQKTTSAAKLYKECSQSYMNAIRILLSILKKQEESEQDELLKRLSEFMET